MGWVEGWGMSLSSKAGKLPSLKQQVAVEVFGPKLPVIASMCLGDSTKLEA
jgi:hypothetical protein